VGSSEAIASRSLSVARVDEFTRGYRFGLRDALDIIDDGNHKKWVRDLKELLRLGPYVEKPTRKPTDAIAESAARLEVGEENVG
jgi:hypothetical protein